MTAVSLSFTIGGIEKFVPRSACAEDGQCHPVEAAF